MNRRVLGFLAAGILFAVLISAFFARRHLVVRLVATGAPPPLLDRADEGPTADWLDDYYTLERIDERTFAIGEPRYAQQTFSYLILGSERAVLFDAGPGVRDIRPIVASITDLPVTFVPSHFHFDHVGDQYVFDRVAIPDLPGLRARALDGVLRLTSTEHLGFAEGYAPRSLEVDEWLDPGAALSLGERILRVLATPGHTPESISLLDEAAGYLFSGDFIYPGPLFAFLPNSSMAHYEKGAQTVIDAVSADVRVFGAHRVGPPGMPELGFVDLDDLHKSLAAIRLRYMEGEGRYPVIYSLNDRVELWAEPRWLQRW